MSEEWDGLDIAQLRATFKPEAYELVAELETALLSLEESPRDMDAVGRVFRALHTLKGSGGACGFDDIAAFVHVIEGVFDAVRNGRASASRQLIDLALAARDRIASMLDAHYGGTPPERERIRELMSRFQAMLPAASERAQTVASPRGKQPLATFRIRLRLLPDAALPAPELKSLCEELAGLGPCTFVGDIKREEGLPAGAHMDSILTTDQGIDAVRDVFIFVHNGGKVIIEEIDIESGALDEEDYKRLGEILVERGDLKPGDVERVIAAQKRIGQLLVESGLTGPDEVAAALTEQQRVRELRQERKRSEDTASVRVPSQKLDALVNLVGELVTVQARLSQAASESTSPKLTAIAEEVERLTADLRDNAMSIRMLPIGTMFSAFKRLVRDLSRNLGKDVDLVTNGAETELDKNVIERLHDPLVHIIRNCMDHGIESPDARAAAGKPRQGTIALSAAHSAAHVLITIEDDGAGLDTDVIRAKAVERGLLAPDANPDERELFNLVVAPGFSTSEKITDVSGRGVGMDVVKRAIETLRGVIDIQSAKGRGTTITLSLPLTLAIIDGFLTKIAGDHFVFPLALVEECVELSAAVSAGTHGRDLLKVRGEIVPFVRLRERFGAPGKKPEIEQVVITRLEGAKVGFVVDGILGGHQTVIKSLGKIYRGIDGISGATILGDGNVALILDVPRLARQAADWVLAAP